METSGSSPLGERDEQRVGGGEVLSQLECAVAQRQGREQLDSQVAEILDGTPGALLAELPAQDVAAQDGEHLEDEQVRCGRRPGLGQQVRDRGGDAVGEQIVDRRGAVQDRHSPESRRRRTDRSLGSARLTDPRVRARSASSSGVGRAASRARSDRRYSESAWMEPR